MKMERTGRDGGMLVRAGLRGGLWHPHYHPPPLRLTGSIFLGEKNGGFSLEHERTRAESTRAK